MKKTLVSTILAFATVLGAYAADYKCISNICYGEARSDVPADDPTQARVLDIHYPEGEAPAKGWPVVVFIHGGGFSGGSKDMSSGLKPLFHGMLEKGYAVVSINYCLSGKNQKPNHISCSSQTKKGFPKSGQFHEKLQKYIKDACEDADLAMDWLAANSREYSLNRKRMAVMGGSAGAITALYCAFVYPPSRAKIKAVINCWGAIHDVNAIKNRRVPVLTFHGDKDALVHVCYGKAISQRMEELGSKDSKFVFMEGKGHAQYKYVGESLIGEVTDFLDKVL